MGGITGDPQQLPSLIGCVPKNLAVNDPPRQERPAGRRWSRNGHQRHMPKSRGTVAPSPEPARRLPLRNLPDDKIKAGAQAMPG